MFMILSLFLPFVCSFGRFVDFFVLNVRIAFVCRFFFVIYCFRGKSNHPNEPYSFKVVFFFLLQMISEVNRKRTTKLRKTKLKAVLLRNAVKTKTIEFFAL